MLAVFLFVLGLALGSFFNCLVYRLNDPKFKRRRKRKVDSRSGFLLGGRSFCPKCKHQLAWKDNLPLLSFILLRGHCRYCRSPISWQYPLVELATGLATVLVFSWSLGVAQNNLVTTFYYLLITYWLIIIFTSDLVYMVIPDEVVYSGIGIAAFFQLLSGFHLEAFLTGLGAALFFLGLVWLTKGKGMGGGDVKLAGLMGLVLGWTKLVVALYLAFLTGALVGVILILLKKKRFGQTVPFGPFLVMGTLVALFWGEMIWAKISKLLL